MRHQLGGGTSALAGCLHSVFWPASQTLNAAFPQMFKEALPHRACVSPLPCPCARSSPQGGITTKEGEYAGHYQGEGKARRGGFGMGMLLRAPVPCCDAACFASLLTRRACLPVWPLMLFV